jgi:aspartyl-tRNA(Asn)/glutamyl-tRNA(Gln) amidotransferase subunit A
MSNQEIAFLSGAELLSAYRKRALSPVEATQATLERIDRLNPALNAYLCVDYDGALAAAREAERIWGQPGEKPLLCGVPVSIKDLIYTTWLPTTHGSLVFKDYRHPQNAPVVDRVLAAGGVILGKTNTPEFGLLDVTRNRLRDECRNPWNLEHTPGGSSGGAGAAVATGMGPLAIGTDGAGSIRIPALHCGLYGLKPSFGRVPHDGWKGAPHTSHQGPMTRTVRDAVLLMQATAGPDARDALCITAPPPNFFEAIEPRVWSGTRIAMSLDYGHMDVDPEIHQAVLDAAALLRSLGCEIIESHPPRLEGGDAGIDLLSPEEYAYAIMIKPDFDEHLGELCDYAQRIIEAAKAMPAWKFSQAIRRREAWAAAVHRWFRDFDFFLAPVMGETARRCDARFPWEEGRAWAGAFLPIFNASGNPAASVPFGFHSNGLPLAVQLAGRARDDAGVLRLSAAIEAARPWADRWPLIAAEGATESAQAGREYAQSKGQR